jgi:hypothetical protein
MIGPRRRHDLGLGPRARVLRHRRGREDVRGGAHPHRAAPDGGLQFARVVQRRLASCRQPEDAGQRLRILSVEDDMESILEWNTKEGIIFRGGSGSGINLSKIRGSIEPLSRGGTASGPVAFMRGADAWGGLDQVRRWHAQGCQDGRAGRRSPRHSRVHLGAKAKEGDKAAALRDAGLDMSIDGEGSHSIQYQNTINSEAKRGQSNAAYLDFQGERPPVAGASDGKTVRPIRDHFGDESRACDNRSDHSATGVRRSGLVALA